MDSLLQDIRYALRTFRTSPGFVAIALLTLAIGIGSNAAIFSVVKTVLLRPLGIHDPDRVFMLWARNLPRNIPQGLASPARFTDWKNENRVFTDMGAATDALYTLTGSGEPQDLVAWQLSANFLNVLGAQPMLGHAFTPENEQLGHDQVVILSQRVWQTRFGADRDIVGRGITLNDKPFTVIGVMKPEFTFPSDITDIWTPLVIPADTASSRKVQNLRVVARIRDGVTLQQAKADMAQISASLAQRYPDMEKGWDVTFESVRDRQSGDVRTPLLALAVAVGFVLLIACVNTANLLLARAAVRHRELAVRVALGASRARIVRQVLTESVLLGLLSCMAGLLLARWETVLIVRMFPKNVTNLSIPVVTSIPIDATVIAFCIGLAFLTSLIFGTMPALHASGVAPSNALKGTSANIARGNRRSRAVLVGTQVSIALVLLVCAGLMIKSFTRLQHASLGFNPDHVLTMQAFLSRTHYKTDPERSRFVQQVVEHVQQLPGVESVGAVNFLPLSGFWGTLSFSAPGAAPAPVAQWPEADYRIATDDYFRTMQIPLLRGRGFGSQDTSQSQPVCIINNTMARKFFPGRDPVGEFLTADPSIFDPKPFLIIGVIGDVKHFGAAEESHAEVYRPFTQDGFPLIALTVRTRPEPMTLADSVRRAIWSVDARQSVFRVGTMEDSAADITALRRVSAVIFVFFSAVALFLAVIGVYGVVSYLVVQQTREIGIRIALGAQATTVMRMVLGYSLRVSLAGVAVGLPLTIAVVRLLRALLYQVSPSDPTILLLVPALLCLVAVIAAWLPASRASRVHPMEALRTE